MALLGGKKYLSDFAKAKTTFTARARQHATYIAPGVNIEVTFKPISMGFEAESFYFPEKNSMLFTVDDMWFEANMYNIDSKMFDGLQVHELCHLKLDIEDYQKGRVTIEDLMENPPQHHGTKRYRDCVLGEDVPKRFARATSDPSHTSFQNYLGSEEGSVPIDIFFIYEIHCPTCADDYLVNLLSFLDETRPQVFYEGRERTFVDYIYSPNKILTELRMGCEECEGPIEQIRHLTPIEVYAEDKAARGRLTDDLMLFA